MGAMISFVETKLLTRLVQEYLSDDEYSELQQSLIANPEAGAVIVGLGGVRKLRWAIRGRGKRGGIRVIYFPAHATRPDLDAYALSEERCRKHSRAYFETDQGRDRWLRLQKRETSA